MTIDVKRFFESGNESRDFEFELDLCQTEIWGRKPFSAPARISARIMSKSSIVTLAYNAFVPVHTFCDRCLTEFDRQFEFSFEYTLVKELQDSDKEGYILIEGDRLDLDQLCTGDIVLNLPLKFLCRNDCKGLCSVCGKNLNLSDCDCLNGQTDSRLAVLKELLK